MTPLISLKISDATYNWMIKKTARNEVCIKATYNYLLKSCILAVIIIGAASRFVHIWNVGLFLAIMVLEPILETTQKILRGLKNQKLFAASGIIYTGILVSLNFLTVLRLEIGCYKSACKYNYQSCHKYCTHFLPGKKNEMLVSGSRQIRTSDHAKRNAEILDAFSAIDT